VRFKGEKTVQEGSRRCCRTEFRLVVIRLTKTADAIGYEGLLLHTWDQEII
jgi:hypothetical protein